MTPESAGTNQIYNEWRLFLRLFGRQFGLAAGQSATVRLVGETIAIVNHLDRGRYCRFPGSFLRDPTSNAASDSGFSRVDADSLDEDREVLRLQYSCLQIFSWRRE